ncbi:MAG: hypothetical protein K6T71_06320, partial [Candidatus Bipolaricaulota bacterium]|nr:hypothetical protein [Candidatus Bipolaricaulota bacterium]
MTRFIVSLALVLVAGVQGTSAQAPQFFLNNQPLVVKNRVLAEGDHVLVPLVEFARLLGAETTVSYESVTLRWGRNSISIPTEHLVARGPLLY